MDNNLQVLLTLLFLLAAVDHHTTTAYMSRRKDVHRTTTVTVFSDAISPTLMDSFINGVVVLEEWRDVNGVTTMQTLVDVFTKVTCALY